LALSARLCFSEDTSLRSPLKVLINYASAAFARSQRLNSDTGLMIGGFDRAISYTRTDIAVEFHRQHRRILASRHGDGYWLWKPYFIHRTLTALEAGDILFYSDAGAYFIAPIDSLLQLCRTTGQDLLVFELQQIERCWTKRDAFVLTQTDIPTYVESRQRLASFSLWRKSRFTEDFCQAWLDSCQDERLLTDRPNTLGHANYSGFVAHRHDQSVFSLLTKRHGLRAFRDPSQWGNAVRERYADSCYGQILVHTRQRANPSFLSGVRARVRHTLRAARAAAARRRFFRLDHLSEPPITRADWQASLSAPLAFYARCCRAFQRGLPEPIRQHRLYFASATPWRSDRPR